MLLNLLNLYSLIFALFSKIEGMSKELSSLQPNLSMNAIVMTDSNLNMSENLSRSVPLTCLETIVPCLPCNMATFPTLNEHRLTSTKSSVRLPNLKMETIKMKTDIIRNKNLAKKILNHQNLGAPNVLIAENLIERGSDSSSDEDTSTNSVLLKELERLRNISKLSNFTETNDSVDTDDGPYYEDYDTSTTDVNENYSPPITPISTNNYEYRSFETTESVSANTVNIDLYADYKPQLNSFTSSDSSKITLIVTEEPYASTSSNLWTQTERTDILFAPTTMTINETITFTTNDSSDNTLSNIDDSMFSSTEINILNTSNTNSLPTDYYDITILSKAYTPTGMVPSTEIDDEWSHVTLKGATASEATILTSSNESKICPNITFNCSNICEEQNITQIFYVVNCTVVEVKCYVTTCISNLDSEDLKRNQSNITTMDTYYTDNRNRKMYNLTIATKKKLLKLCWETMFGQELVKLTMMDLVFVLLGTLFMDFFRALFVRYMNRCWCWDLEKKFPEYGDFKIAENILHLINNQGMVWMGMFFSPGLVVLNIFKLMIMMYLRSWAVMTCNVPHEVVFRVSKSNNFYLALLLTMLFLCVLPVGYTIVWVKPSWHCGPFSGYDKIYHILTTNIYKILPESLNFTLEYIASPAIVIPLLVLLILIIYYLTSLTNSLREANNDLKLQLRRERTEERRKMFQLADSRRRIGSSAMDNTPFARWKKALPSLPTSKSIDSDDRKTTAAEDTKEPIKSIKKKGGIFEKIVSLAIDKKIHPEASKKPSVSIPLANHTEDETDTDFHETLPKEILKIKDICIKKNADSIKKSCVESKTAEDYRHDNDEKINLKLDNASSIKERKAALNKTKEGKKNEVFITQYKHTKADLVESNEKFITKMSEKQTSETSNQSKQSDSGGSVIPVITISTTESDEEILVGKNSKDEKDLKRNSKDRKDTGSIPNKTKKSIKHSSDSKSLRRQSSVDSNNETKFKKEKKADVGHKYQYSL